MSTPTTMSASFLGLIDMIPKANYNTRYYTPRGDEAFQVFQGLPFLEKFYTQWEKDYNAIPLYFFIMNNSWLPVVAVALYLSFIFGYPVLAKKFGIGYISARKYIAAWNLLLAVFSWMGAFRVVPQYFFMLANEGFQRTVCLPPDQYYGTGAAGFWVQLFVISKVFELIDTVFIVLRQKKPMFLHWYHHVTVLLFCWFTYKMESSGFTFIAMNYSIHAVMYSYYFLMVIRKVPAWFPAGLITIAQIMQMVVGVYVAWIFYSTLSAGEACQMDPRLLMACGVMYSTYLYLFVEFAVKRYLLKPMTKSGKGVSKGEKAQ